MKKRARRRGAGLATVLMLTALLVALAFTVVGVAFNHLNMTTVSSNGQHARNLAEAAISLAIDKVFKDEKFGTTGYAQVGPVEVKYPAPTPDSYGVVCFTDADATKFKTRKSTNNLASGTAVPGDGCYVPKTSVHLVGKGYCNGISKTIDAVVYISPFPYTLASSGQIRSEGDLLVAELKPGGDPDKPEDYLTGHLITNSAKGSDAIDFGSAANVIIKGDAQSHSGATFGSALIEGERRLGADKVQLRDLDIPSFDVEYKPGAQNITMPAGGISSTTPIKGFKRTKPTDNGGNLQFNNGLNLDGGVLYVSGDLTVNGGINGTGAVIVKGNATFTNGGGTMTGGSQLALLAGGNLSLQGSPTTPQRVRGLIYTEGNFNALDARILGPVIGNDGVGANSMNLTRTSLLNEKSLLNVSFDVQVSDDPGPPADEVAVGNVTMGQSWSMDMENPATYETILPPKTGSFPDGSAEFSNSPPSRLPVPASLGGGFIDVDVRAVLHPDSAVESRFKDPGTGKYAAPYYNPGINKPAGNYIWDPNAVKADGTQGDMVPYTGGVTPLGVGDLNIKVGANPPKKGSDATWVTDAANLYVESVRAKRLAGGYPDLTSTQVLVLRTQGNAYFNGVQKAQLIQGVVVGFGKKVTSTTTKITFQDAIDSNYATTGTVSKVPWNFSFDDATVLKIEDRARVLYWRETQ